jgi:predicted amino acid racemase
MLLMVETGDLRDGIPWADLPGVVRSLAREPGLVLRGLGTNLGCLAGAVPDGQALETMAEGLRAVRRATGQPLPEFSLGGTVFWDTLARGPIPPEFTEFRVGEAVFFGWNTSLGKAVPGLSPVFRLDLDVLEAWEKDVRSKPLGPAGFNAFGLRSSQTLTGLRRRAVLDGGGNFAPAAALTPEDAGCILVGETHEYTVVDWQALGRPLVSGDRLSFRPAYEAVARSFLSPFLEWTRGEEG